MNKHWLEQMERYEPEQPRLPEHLGGTLLILTARLGGHASLAQARKEVLRAFLIWPGNQWPEPSH